MIYAPVKVIDFELSEPMDVVGLDAYSKIQVLARLFHRPVGYVWLTLRNGECAGGTIAKTILEEHNLMIIQHLVELNLASAIGNNGLLLEELVNTACPKYCGSRPIVSVAVCTRDRTESLQQCLQSLAALHYADIEVLVIDNAPATDATRDLIKHNFPGFHYVREIRPGLDWARNRAIKEASGEIIAFTDDDVIVDSFWIDAIVQAFDENPEVMAVTGLVIPHELETEAQFLFEEYGGFGRGFKRQWYSVSAEDGERTVQLYGAAGMFGTGANMAYRSTLFEQIGPFDEALDVGTVTNGGGDIEMFFRLLQKGFALLYEPAAIIRHRHRHNLRDFQKQIANNGVGFSSYLIRSVKSHPGERLTIIRFWLGWLRWWHLRRIYNSIRGKDKFSRMLIYAELRGYLSGLFRYGKARRIANKLAENN